MLAFAAEDWEQVTGTPFLEPRSFDALNRDVEFAEAGETGRGGCDPFAAHAAADSPFP